MVSRKKPFSPSRKHSRYRVENWSEYNNGLRNRGRLDFMISSDLGSHWYVSHPKRRNRGGQDLYSDQAILLCLQIRCLFGLKLRQTQGFITYLFMISGLNLTCPDYTTLCRRGRQLHLSHLFSTQQQKFDFVSIDSTGIQTFTGNEWLRSKHGKCYNRRTWKKLHVVVNNEGLIVSQSLISHTCDDRSQVDILLRDIEAKELLGDAGYDGETVYQKVKHRSMKPVIRPPNKSAPRNKKTERQQAISYQSRKGYQAWRTKHNYGRREQVENTFFRYKTSFGSKALSRDEKNIKTEMAIKCHLLNKMFQTARPISVPIK